MICPPELQELEFTFRCRIATYSPQELINIQSNIMDSLQRRMISNVDTKGIVSSPESRLERVK